MRGITKILILSTLIAVSVVSIVTLRIVFLLHHGQCQLGSDEPRAHSSGNNGTVAKNIGSSDNSALANFVGWILMRTVDRYKGTYESRYLQLDLKRVEHIKVDESEGISQLQLDLECARMNFDILSLDRGGRYVVVDAKLEPKSDYAPHFKLCHIASKEFGTRSYEHYRCQQQRVYGCWDVPPLNRINASNESTTNLVSLELVVEKFEFEINGNAEKIERGQFSKVTVDC